MIHILITLCLFYYILSFGFKLTVNTLCLYSWHVFCIWNVLRFPKKIGECSLGLASLNKDIIINIILDKKRIGNGGK